MSPAHPSRASTRPAQDGPLARAITRRLTTLLAVILATLYLLQAAGPLRLTTDTGLTGLGEASLEWQERAVEAIVHDWLAERIVGADPFDVEKLNEDLIRDQYDLATTIEDFDIHVRRTRPRPPPAPLPPFDDD